MKILLTIICLVFFFDYGKTQVPAIIRLGRAASGVSHLSKTSSISKRLPIKSVTFSNYRLPIKSVTPFNYSNEFKRKKDFDFDLTDLMDSTSNIIFEKKELSFNLPKVSKTLKFDQVMIQDTALLRILRTTDPPKSLIDTKNLLYDIFEMDSISKYYYSPANKEITFMGDGFLLLRSIKKITKPDSSLSYFETSNISENKRGIYDSYLDQKLKENINKELINFNQEINSIIIKSKYRFNQ